MAEHLSFFDLMRRKKRKVEEPPEEGPRFTDLLRDPDDAKPTPSAPGPSATPVTNAAAPHPVPWSVQQAPSHHPPAHVLHPTPQSGHNTDALSLDLRTLATIFMYHKWIILGVVATVFLVNLVIAWRAPQIWSARLTILKAGEDGKPGMMMGMDQGGMTLETASSLLTTMPVFVSAVVSLKSALSEYRSSDPSLVDEDLQRLLAKAKPQDMQELLQLDMDGLRGMVETHILTEQSMIEIRTTWGNPVAAAVGAQVLAKSFIQQDVGSKRKGNTDSIELLSVLIKEKEGDVKRLSQEILAFKSRTATLVGEGSDGPDYLNRDGRALIANLSQRNARLDEERMRQRAINFSISNLQVLMDEEVKRSVAMEYKKKLADLNKELAEALTRYTEENPKVVTLRGSIAMVQDAIGKEERKPLEDKVKDAQQHNPYYRQLQQQMLNYRSELDISKASQDNLSKKVEEIDAKLTRLDNENLKLAEMEDRLLQVKTVLAELTKQQNAAKITAAAIKSSFSIVENADVPRRPTGLGFTHRVLLGIVMGLVIAFGLALFLEHLHNTLRTPEEAKRHFHLPVLGVIPHWGKDDEIHIDPAHTDSLIAEYYAVLRTNIRYSASNNPERMLLVSSAVQHEGKSTSTLNLAISFALDGSRTLFVCADMRKQNHAEVRERLRCTDDLSLGLSDYLSAAQDGDWRAFVHKTGLEELSVISSGSAVANTPRLLATDRMSNLLKEAEAAYEVVIIDGTAVLPVVDLTILSGKMRAVVLLIRAESTPIKVVENCLERLRQVKSPMVGIILNRANAHTLSRYYGYKGGYYPGSYRRAAYYSST